jgi:transposase InsO family protein
MIRDMSLANPLWGAPRIHGELLKLGIEVGQTSVAKYMVRRRGGPSQGWRTFLCNHADGIASMDLFVVPTLSFRLLYGFLVLRHHRRRIMWLGVTANPTAEWIARQLTEACGWETAPGYIVRDRDCAYGKAYVRRLRAMGIRDRPTAPRSPWQNAYAQRLIGSIRREVLDHVVVLGERHLRHLLLSYMTYCNEAGTHLSLDADAPIRREVQSVCRIVVKPHFGGLHHPRRCPLLALHRHIEIAQCLTNVFLDLAPEELRVTLDHIRRGLVAEFFGDAVLDEFIVERVPN